MIGLRTRMIYATLALSATAWSLDFLTARIPEEAKAAAKGEAPEETGQISADDLQAVISALRTVPRQRAPLALSPRNLFEPPAAPPKIVNPPPAAATAGAADASAPDGVTIADPPPALPDLVLDGIMAGRRRLALINGNVVATGQRVQGYRVRFIGADHVLLDGRAGRLRLDLAKPELRQQNN